MNYNVIADEIVMTDVAELPEPDQVAFANLLIDLMIDPWIDSVPYWRHFPAGDPMRRKDFGHSARRSLRYWIDADRRLVTVLNVIEDDQP